jgi:hypothetical protein
MMTSILVTMLLWGQYEDLMAAGIIDPTKVCGLVVSLFLLALIGIVDSAPSAELDSLTKG